MTVAARPDAPAPAPTGPSARARRRHVGRRMARTAGALLVLLGVVVLLFGAYLLWGTGLTEASHQQALRRQWASEEARARQAASGAVTGGAAPLSGAQPVPAGPPPAVGRPVGTISIPAIGVRQVVVQGTGTAQLREGPGHYPATPMPGQPGNAAIAGHRTTYGAPFFHLDALVRGDAVYVSTVQGRFRYDVVRSFVVAPSDVAVVGPSPVAELTLTTCNPRYSASQRLVVQAVLVGPTAPAGRPGTAVAGAGRGGGNVAAAVAWGAAWGVVTAAVWWVARRRRRRWPVALVGLPVVLVVLLLFFSQVAPLLPASF